MNLNGIRESKNYSIDELSYILSSLHGPKFDITQLPQDATTMDVIRHALMRHQMLNPTPPFSSPVPSGQILNAPVPGYTPFEVPFPNMYVPR
jgi:hypothetical protein